MKLSEETKCLLGSWLRAFVAGIAALGINGNFRARYAGIGMRYDEELDEFVEQEIPSP